ncbi:MAG: DUF4238 domain-containing protein [Alphaproteobacteria bacterium]|nr:DUF4238 domain-containing protein [Alphaproteobacteria bacterium]
MEFSISDGLSKLKDYAVQHNILMAFELAPALWDLKPILIINKTREDFITSDNPVVRVNQFWRRKFTGYGVGLSNAGLLIYLPLSPGCTLLMYDDAVYHIVCDSHNRINVKSGKDVRAINRLQMLNAVDNIYFSNPLNGGKLCIELKSVLSQRRKSYSDFAEFVPGNIDGQYIRQKNSEDATIDK